MDPERLNKWIAPLANIGVLLGLAVLIFEIRQNNELTMAQIEQSRSESFVQFQGEIASSDHVAPTLAKIQQLGTEYSDQPERDMAASERQRLAQFVFEKLDPVERQRANAIAMRAYWDIENLFFQYQRGLVSKSYWTNRIVPSIAVWGPRWKATNGGSLPLGRSEFNDEVERLLAANE